MKLLDLSIGDILGIRSDVIRVRYWHNPNNGSLRDRLLIEFRVTHDG